MINREPIAIIGIGCRFPGAENPEGFWQLLHGGVDAITEVPSSRWNLETFYEQDTEKPEKMSIRWGGFLKQVDLFDPQFFAIAPREAVSIDPQQRLLLEVAWEALEDSGQIPEHLAGKPTGVFIGVSSFDYYELLIGNPSNIDAYAATGNTNCIAANRISYIFGFTGPSIAIDTACSSSLVAVHLACQSLWSGECSLALAGGVHVMLSPWVTVGFAKGGFLAPDGRCKTFDARANGYVRSEGAGMVVLKTLSQALADGDRIYAVIQGSAVNQDGRSNGLTAPNPKAQEAVLREAYFKAGVSPGQIQYIEAHGTGTKLGDPIEMKALGKVLAEGRLQGSYCKVGSVKTNIGHLEAAAGIAGLIKVALSLKHRQIPPSLHFQKPNPYIPFDKLPLRVQQTLSPWPQGTGLALAGVSSFGFGGTNAHVVLAEAPLLSQNSKAKSQKKKAIERQLHLLTLSAKSEKALLEMAQSYQEFLLKHPEVSLADVCFTANTGRSHFDYRLAIIAESKVQLQKELSAFTASGETNTVVSGQVKSKKRSKVAFLFTGQGSQYIGMGRQLYETAPIFRQTLDRCDEILRSYLDKSLLSVLYPQAGETSPLDQTAYTQPALFAIEYALSELWKSWGIVPTAVMGHSLGEYVAACVAGVLSLEDGLKLIAARSQLMQSLPAGGEMVAVYASEETIRAITELYTDKVAIAALNGPENTVISGEAQTVGSICASLEAAGITTKKLQTSHAFHSPLMEPILAQFREVAATVNYATPQIEIISNLTGEQLTSQEISPDYWCQHLRRPVQFAKSIKTLNAKGYEVFVEIGAKPTLLGMGRNCLSEQVGVWLPSLRPGVSDWQQMLQSLAGLYVRGVEVDWVGFNRDNNRKRVALPTYPFQRQRYWVENTKVTIDKIVKLSTNRDQFRQTHPLLGRRLNSPLKLKEIQFSSQISQNSPAYLQHHRVYQKVIVPASAYIEMALAAGAAVLKSDDLVLEDIVIQQALMLDDEQEKTIQLILTPDENSAYSFQIFSLTEESEDQQTVWTLHVSGKVFKADQCSQSSPENWESFITQDTQEISPINLYQEFRSRGIDYGESFQAIEKLWHKQGEAIKGNGYEQLSSEEFRIDPTQPEDFSQLLTTVGANQSLYGIVNCWSIDAVTAQALSSDNLQTALQSVCGSTLHLVQAIAQAGFPELPRLWLVTKGAQSVTSANSQVPGIVQSPLWGMGKVIALEHPELNCVRVDLDPEAVGDEVQELFEEIWSENAEDQVAFRDQERYVARLVRRQQINDSVIVERTPHKLPVLREDSTYLITGGIGGLGLLVARWMVNKGARYLVLVGRSGASSNQNNQLKELEQAGANVIVATTDVSDIEQIRRVLSQIEESLPPLAGVIHAAGVLDDGILQQQSWQRFANVMAPKVLGAWNLHTLTQNLPLDFFVLLSSSASLLGSPGQANHAAANAFLDALAYYRRCFGLPGLSINWGAVSEIGAAAGRSIGDRLKTRGIGTIAPHQVLEVLEEYLFNQSSVQFGIVPINWSEFDEQFARWSFLSDFQQASGQLAQQHSQLVQQHEFFEQLKNATTHEQQTLLMTYVRSQVAKVLGLTNQLDVDKPLNNMGLDSLTALELRNWVQNNFGVDIPIVKFMEGLSVASITAYVSEQLTEVKSTTETSVELAVTSNLDNWIEGRL